AEGQGAERGGAQGRRRASWPGESGQEGGGRVRGAVPVARSDGADELHGARARGWRGGVGADPESDHLARSGGADARHTARKSEPAHLVYGWRLRTARRR